MCIVDLETTWSKEFSAFLR